jgi:rhodanese-related sulfurtransferase
MGFFRDRAKGLVKRALNRERNQAPVAPSAPAEEEPGGEQFAQMACGAQELKERLDAGEDVLLVDVRESRELKSGLLPDAVHIPMRELTTRWEEVAQANEIVCYCQVGARSLETALFLRSKGLFNATSLEGGIVAWRAIGGDITTAS